jgi:hypothetical protein
MTIAIGTHFTGGVALCADTRVVDTNGNVTYARKVILNDPGNGRTFAIAHAADDTNAADMLSHDMLTALSALTNPVNIEPTIKQMMTQWQSDYAQTAVPFLQFIVAGAFDNQPLLYFCQPPNVVIRKWEPIAIGSAGKTVDVLLPFVLVSPSNEYYPGPLHMSATSTLLKLAYLMRRSKSEDLYAGGDTDAALIFSNGRSTWAERREMKKAEEFSLHMESQFEWCCYGLFSQKSKEEQADFIKRFSDIYMRDAEEASKFRFRSLQRF